MVSARTPRENPRAEQLPAIPTQLLNFLKNLLLFLAFLAVQLNLFLSFSLLIAILELWKQAL